VRWQSSAACFVGVDDGAAEQVPSAGASHKRGVFVGAMGNSYWPRMSIFMSAYGQFFTSADNPANRREKQQPPPPRRKEQPLSSRNTVVIGPPQNATAVTA
jgi:hypothetical protein